MNSIWLNAVRASAGGATPWYLAGGAPTPIAVYQPIGAESLAASYVNLANPGTFDAAPGVAPTWDATTGWTSNGAQHLVTGISPVVSAGITNYTIIIRFSSSQNTLCGYLAAGTNSSGFGLAASVLSPARTRWYNGNRVESTLTYPLSGVMAVAGLTAYLDGTLVGNISSGSGLSSSEIWLLGMHRVDNGTLLSGLIGSVQTVAIYPTSTSHATWVPAVSEAMSLL